MNESSQSEIVLSRSGRRTSSPSSECFLGEGGQMRGRGGIGDEKLYRFKKWQGMRSSASDNDVGLTLKEADLQQHCDSKSANMGYCATLVSRYSTNRLGITLGPS